MTTSSKRGDEDDEEGRNGEYDAIFDSQNY